ncbi:hypothetical protein Aperf_G00000038921 [Anoplocephala perfoliata]
MTELLDHGDQFRCCVYLHVRTGTVILGVLHILLQLIVVSTLLMAALRHDVTSFKFDTVTSVNCQPRNPPTDIFYMLMHIVPGFTIFHQTHSDFTARFRAENSTQREFFRASQDASKPSSLFDFLMGGANETSNEAKEDVEITKKDEAAPPPKPEVVKIASSKALTDPRCIDRRTNTYFSLCLALISLAFGYLLVHGVISRQPAHLLPFFCLQVFDFVVALICMLGYMSSASDISHWLRLKIATQEGVSASSIHLNSTSVSLILISTSCLILAFKAYCIGMVWDCHRYLLITNRHGGLLPSADIIPRFAALAPFLGRRRPLVLIHRRGRGSGSSSGGFPDLTTCDGTRVFVDALPTEPPKDSALPKYEEALSVPANAFAPPPYFATKSTPEETRVKLWNAKEETKASGNNSPVAGDTAFKPDNGGKNDDPTAGPSVV